MFPLFYKSNENKMTDEVVRQALYKVCDTLGMRIVFDKDPYDYKKDFFLIDHGGSKPRFLTEEGLKNIGWEIGKVSKRMDDIEKLLNLLVSHLGLRLDTEWRLDKKLEIKLK